MRVRQLERLLIENGVGAAKIDAVTRRLREIDRLPTGGRGPFAPHIGSPEAASILLALAGSTKGAEADYRLKKLEVLRCTSGAMAGQALLDALINLLEHPEAIARVKELRVSRTTRRAQLVFMDGTIDEFRTDAEPKPAAFYVEGILPAELLRKTSEELGKDRQESARTGAQE